jgi:polo-like kinase 4
VFKSTPPPKENLNEDSRVIYFFRFVNLVKAKTPKVTFYSDKAKCLLMENDPDPDFEVCFYEGKKL